MHDIGIGLGTSVLNHTKKVKACSVKLINQRTQISLAEWYIISDNPLPVQKRWCRRECNYLETKMK